MDSGLNGIKQQQKWKIVLKGIIFQSCDISGDKYVKCPCIKRNLSNMEMDIKTCLFNQKFRKMSGVQ
jgi:hypothetical protein